MNVLILGSTGVLGSTLELFLKDKKLKLSFISRKKNLKHHKYLNNFSNYKKLKKIISEIKPKIIINCIGITKFHKDYDDIEATKLINTKLPIILSKYCLKNKIYFLHISTDCVFLGNKGNYLDISKKDAKDLYGLTKNNGEVKNEFSSTIRTSFIGPEKNSNKSLFNWFLNEKHQVNGYSRAFFSGLTSVELSKIIYKYFIMKNDFYNQIINIGGKKISKYHLLKKIKIIFNKEIKIKNYSNFKIDRSLNSSRFRKLSKYKLPKWDYLINELKLFMKKNNYKY